MKRFNVAYRLWFIKDCLGATDLWYLLTQRLRQTFIHQLIWNRIFEIKLKLSNVIKFKSLLLAGAWGLLTQILNLVLYSLQRFLEKKNFPWAYFCSIFSLEDIGIGVCWDLIDSWGLLTTETNATKLSILKTLFCIFVIETLHFSPICKPD